MKLILENWRTFLEEGYEPATWTFWHHMKDPRKIKELCASGGARPIEDKLNAWGARMHNVHGVGFYTFTNLDSKNFKSYGRYLMRIKITPDAGARLLITDPDMAFGELPSEQMIRHELLEPDQVKGSSWEALDEAFKKGARSEIAGLAKGLTSSTQKLTRQQASAKFGHTTVTGVMPRMTRTKWKENLDALVFPAGDDYWGLFLKDLSQIPGTKVDFMVSDGAGKMGTAIYCSDIIKTPEASLSNLFWKSSATENIQGLTFEDKITK